MSDVGTYLYAVAMERDSAATQGLTGVAGRAVQAIPHAGLVAYVSAVPLTEFGEEPLRQSLEDLDWLGETARAHHRVVAAVAAKAPIAPVRLVTIYNDEAQVRTLLERRHEAFMEVLAQIADRQEWGVKVYVPPPDDRPAQESAAGGGPGAAYLKKRQAGLHNREEAWRRAIARAELIHKTLESLAEASHLHRPQDPQLSGREDWMVLNGAYLVDEERGQEFGQVVERLRGEGVDLELTGPWAPYSFTTSVEAGAEGEQDDRR
ncbi:GvpL/GvpF family gas vesicle protein [Streptosporangiaceae bacterium NEAU-GS5]|nr:GvpL/GvpF family gas vesicle protein [Streptosporangiaceae bacterium NEAU-GS5]